MEDLIAQLVLQALMSALKKKLEEGINYIIRKVVDSSGNTSTQIVYELDTDGDGINDSEEIIYTLETMIPDLDSGYCLVNKGDEIGLGMPQIKLLDGADISTVIDIGSDFITGNGDGFIVDFDGDGANDDILIPLPDFSGDGQGDWGWLVDDDDNGLPDASPYAPFYPIGSDEYTYIVEKQSAEDMFIMEKPIDDYSVTEGLLALLVIFVGLNFVRGLFTRKDVFRR